MVAMCNARVKSAHKWWGKELETNNVSGEKTDGDPTDWGMQLLPTSPLHELIGTSNLSLSAAEATL
jgi:hypothetical protein